MIDPVKKTPVFIIAMILMAIALAFVAFHATKISNDTETVRSSSLGINPDSLDENINDDMSEEEFYADPVNERAMKPETKRNNKLNIKR